MSANWQRAGLAASVIASGAFADDLRITQADFLPFDPAKAAIGQLLFYDPILSGNRNISCGTCHNHDLASADGLSLGIGEGGQGIGTKRTAGTGSDRIERRVPRNAPGLWNLGAREVRVLFHDGRISRSDDYGTGFDSPAEEFLPKGLPNLLAVQALFPLTSETEMTGSPEENEIAGRVNDRIDLAWPILAKRVRSIPGYAEMFVRSFKDIETAEEVTIVHIATALSDFINAEWRSHDSAYDAYLRGDGPLSSAAERGRELFFGEAGCAACHSGKFLTDQNFHALALPHFGPGRTRRFDPYVRDVGRMGESDVLEDAYRFRTPSLRNVSLTAPYGHNGAYPTLEGIIRHHLDPLAALEAWKTETAALPKAQWLENVDFIALQDRRERDRLKSRIDIEPRRLKAQDISDLVSFLHALEGTESIKGRLGKPVSVPSGLKVD